MANLNLGEDSRVRVVRRAAIDIGSGATKLLIADVDPDAGRIIREVYGKESAVSFSLASKRHPSGELNDAVQDQGISVLRAYKATMQEYGVNCCAAIATEVFRKAPNGPEFLRRVFCEVDIDARLISQTTEAELGFRTAAALSSEELSDRDIVCWDSGGGSFQITSLDPESGLLRSPYMGSLGSGVVAAECIEVIHGVSASVRGSPNPLTRRQFDGLVDHLRGQLVRGVPEWLREAPMMTMIGGPLSLGQLCTNLCGSTTFTTHDVIGCVSKVIDRSDAEFESLGMGEPHLVAVKLAFCLAVMLQLEMRTMQYKAAIGSCAGMVTHPGFRTFEVATIDV